MKEWSEKPMIDWAKALRDHTSGWAAQATGYMEPDNVDCLEILTEILHKPEGDEGAHRFLALRGINNIISDNIDYDCRVRIYQISWQGSVYRIDENVFENVYCSVVRIQSDRFDHNRQSAVKLAKRLGVSRARKQVRSMSRRLPEVIGKLRVGLLKDIQGVVRGNQSMACGHPSVIADICAARELTKSQLGPDESKLFDDILQELEGGALA